MCVCVCVFHILLSNVFNYDARLNMGMMRFWSMFYVNLSSVVIHKFHIILISINHDSLVIKSMNLIQKLLLKLL